MGAFVVSFLVTIILLAAIRWFESDHAVNKEPPPREDLIPDLPKWFNFDKLKSLVSSVSYAVPVLNQELIQWSLDFAEKVPDFKVCFPEIKRSIVHFCSSDPPFVSEFQYTIIALRVYNCLHLRSLGAREINFEDVEQNFMNYLSKMTKRERNSYQESYNLVRGLCVNERQHKTKEKIRDAIKILNNRVNLYLNCMRTGLPHVAAKFTILQHKKNSKIVERIINENEKMSQRTTQFLKVKLQVYVTYLKNVIEKEDQFIKLLQNTMKTLRKNFKRIEHKVNGENNPLQLWMKFLLAYSCKTNEMDEMVTIVQLNLNQIYKKRVKKRHAKKQKNTEAKRKKRNEQLLAISVYTINFCLVITLIYFEVVKDGIKV